MRIGVDVRCISETGRGVSQYATSLLRELTGRYAGDDWRLVRIGRQPFAVPEGIAADLVHVRRPNRAINAKIALTGQPQLDRLAGPVDVVFAPNLGFLNVSAATPFVVTVHDLSFELHPAWYSGRERLWHRAVRPRRILQQAELVIAVSGQTAAELQEVYGLPEEKIRVVHSAIDSRLRPAQPTEVADVRHRYRLPERYLLYLGALEPRKNIDRMVAAFMAARERGLRSDLVIAGGGILEGLAGVRSIGYIAEADKAAILTGATGLVLISHHEGFGFPPLEALACGTPSVVSDLPVFAETLGEAAVRVTPTETAQIAEQLVHLEHDQGLRQRLLTAGRSVCDRLTWARTAEATYNVLQEAHARRHPTKTS